MEKSVVRGVVLMLLFHAGCVWSDARRERESRTLERLLNSERYNPLIRPGNGSGPVIVKQNMYIRSISALDETKMEYSMQVTFRQQWKDERMEYSDELRINYLTVADPQRIWTPDPFFSNEINGHFHNIVKPNVLLRIYPEGEVLFSIRLSLTLKCPMNLRYYPMDKQTCSIIIASYGYTTEDIVFLWKNEDPVQISKNLNIASFTLDEFFTGTCTSRTNTGEYSCLSVNLRFSRMFTQYLMDIYIPTIVLVILSWLCFALDRKDTTARVVLSAAVFVVFSMKIVCVNSKQPNPDYQTAYSIWVTTCFMFLAAVIAKVGYDAFFLRRQQRKNAFGMALEENDFVKNKESSEEPRASVNAAFRFYYKVMRRCSSAQDKGDVLCLVLFPLAFAIFNIIYWSTNILHSE